MKAKQIAMILLVLSCLISAKWYFHQNNPKEKKPAKAIFTQPHCSPVKDLSFLKLHRVGSEAFHNILVRFAINHNAFVGLANCLNYQVFPLQVSKDLLYPDPLHPNFTGYNMFIDPVIFNKTASNGFLPENAVYISQIRDPFEEAFSVYEYFWAGRPHVPYDLFLTEPERYEMPVNILLPCRAARNYSISRNVMSLELGYTDQSNENMTVFYKYLEELGRDLHHVTILEELPQSLMLIRHKLCWDFKDLLYLDRRTAHSGNRTPRLLNVQRKAHQNWSSLDYRLYEFFLDRHLREVEEQPPWFPEEVEEFARAQKKFSHFCSHVCEMFAGVNPRDTTQIRNILSVSMVYTKTQFYQSFSVSYKDCAMLRLGELTVKKALKFHMNPGLCANNPERAQLLHLSCDVDNHVIPGLTSRDINELMDYKKCRNLELPI